MMESYSEDLWDSESIGSENGEILGLYLKDNERKIDFKFYFGNEEENKQHDRYDSRKYNEEKND